MKKSDSQLQQDVLEELKWEPALHATEVGVEVKDGVVTLSGEVHNFAEKWHAERAAQRVSGVNALAVNMTLKAPGLGARTDADIARAAEQLLGWSTSVAVGAIQVMVENGFITLSGSVGWQFQRLAAAASVRFLVGGTGVSDLITIKPTISMSAVKDDIEVALKRTAVADAKKIHVCVSGSDIMLSGKIQSWAEPETAIASARSTPGAQHVYDKMATEF